MSCQFKERGSWGARELGCLGIATLLGAAPRTTAAQSPPSSPEPGSVAPSYVPHRVYDTRGKRFIDFESLLTRLTGADLVFVGEQHDDPATHRMELALLEGIARRRDSVVLALEMFERDVQPLLDRYLADSATEAELLKDGRPWKNYQTDYRPLVELARARGWPVVASNVPKPLASLVARAGLSGLDTLSPGIRPQRADELRCPEDRYFDRFEKEMGDMSAHGPSPSAAAAPAEAGKQRLERMYQAQCLKDETMGESVARAWRPGRLVLHYNGAFHSDFRMGTAERAERRASGARMLVITAVPVKDLDGLEPSKEDRKRADYLLYVLAPAKADSTKR